MGDIAPSKMPTGKTITRKDNPNKVTVYKKGGKLKVPTGKGIAKKTAKFR